MPGRPTNLDECRTKAYLLAVDVGGDCLNIFLSFIIFLFFFPLSGRRLDIDCSTSASVFNSSLGTWQKFMHGKTCLIPIMAFIA